MTIKVVNKSDIVNELLDLVNDGKQLNKEQKNLMTVFAKKDADTAE